MHCTCMFLVSSSVKLAWSCWRFQCDRDVVHTEAVPRRRVEAVKSHTKGCSALAPVWSLYHILPRFSGSPSLLHKVVQPLKREGWRCVLGRIWGFMQSLVRKILYALSHSVSFSLSHTLTLCHALTHSHSHSGSLSHFHLSMCIDWLHFSWRTSWRISTNPYFPSALYCSKKHTPTHVCVCVCVCVCVLLAV